jgi:uncharacterized membrane protein
MFGRSKPKPPVSPSGIDYEKLGKTVEQVMVKDYIYFIGSTRRQIWGAFVRGVFAGFGGVIGASLVVAFLIFILQYLGGVPVVGHFFHNLSQTIHTSTPK